MTLNRVRSRTKEGMLRRRRRTAPIPSFVESGLGLAGAPSAVPLDIRGPTWRPCQERGRRSRLPSGPPKRSPAQLRQRRTLPVADLNRKPASWHPAARAVSELDVNPDHRGSLEALRPIRSSPDDLPCTAEDCGLPSAMGVPRDTRRRTRPMRWAPGDATSSTWNSPKSEQRALRRDAHPAGIALATEFTPARSPPLRAQTWPSRTRPSVASPSAGQRSGDGSGGSATHSCPPTRRRGAAHSAVTAGAAKLRATTTAAVRLRGTLSPTSSARWPNTSTSKSRASATWPSHCARRCWASTSTQCRPGWPRARMRPGTPAPEPRSTPTPDEGSAPTSGQAWRMWASTGPVPRNPRARASSGKGERRSAPAGRPLRARPERIQGLPGCDRLRPARGDSRLGEVADPGLK